MGWLYKGVFIPIDNLLYSKNQRFSVIFMFFRKEMFFQPNLNSDSNPQFGETKCPIIHALYTITYE